MDSSFVGGDKDDQEFQFDHATTDAEVAQEQPREAIKDFGFAKNMRDVLTMDVQGILATDFEELFARDDQDTFGTGFEDIFSRDVKDDQIDRDSAKMDSILAERIKDDKLNRAAIVNKGAQKQPLNAMPAAGNFLQLIPETSGGGDEVVSTTLYSFHRSPSVMSWRLPGIAHPRLGKPVRFLLTNMSSPVPAPPMPSSWSSSASSPTP